MTKEKLKEIKKLEEIQEIKKSVLVARRLDKIEGTEEFMLAIKDIGGKRNRKASVNSSFDIILI